MGEISEMMLDGTLCQCCGEVLDGTSPGFPRYCENCAREQCNEDMQDVEYDFNFNKVGIEKLAEQIIKKGTRKQMNALLKTLYKVIGKVKKKRDEKQMNKEVANEIKRH